MTLRSVLDTVEGLDFSALNINNGDLDILKDPQVHKWLGVSWSHDAVVSNSHTVSQRIATIVRHACRELDSTPPDKLLALDYWCSVATFVTNEVREEVRETQLA